MITGEQLLEVFAAYNQQIWPLQILAYTLGVIAIFLAFKQTVYASRVIFAILALFWVWVGLFFWFPSARQGFNIGYAFMGLFLVQGVFLLYQAVRGKLTFGTFNKWHTISGLLMISFAMVGYPLVGFFIGHRYPYTPPFGLTPCPLIIFSFGLILLTSSKIPLFLLMIPFGYGLSGVLWISIGIWEDVGMVLGSIIAFVLLLRRNKQLMTEEKLKNQDQSSEAWSLNVTE